jgi:hypothetical protein
MSDPNLPGPSPTSVHEPVLEESPRFFRTWNWSGFVLGFGVALAGPVVYVLVLILLLFLPWETFGDWIGYLLLSPLALGLIQWVWLLPLALVTSVPVAFRPVGAGVLAGGLILTLLNVGAVVAWFAFVGVASMLFV